MRFKISSQSISFLRSAVFGFAAAGLFFAPITASAQRPGEEIPRSGMDRIDQAEGIRRLRDFRQQRLVGDYVFEFQLEHKPRRAPTVRYEGIMWGTWNSRGPLTRFKIFGQPSGGETPQDVVELIVQNGPMPEAWMRRSGGGDFERVEGDALFEPLLPELLYSVFDLQMPFVYWPDFVYEGPSVIGAGRVAQRFLLLPPEDSHSAQRDIKGVRVALDDTYNALWRVEIIDVQDEVRSRFAVESFQKVQEQYIVKRITLTDFSSKDKTTFNVEKADVGLRLDPALFELPKIPRAKSGSLEHESSGQCDAM